MVERHPLDPSHHQKALWGSYLLSEQDRPEDGWWMAWCPLHDNEHDELVPTAFINFSKGSMKCEREPSCHEGKRAMTLQSVKERLEAHVVG